MSTASATYNATPPTLAACNNNYRDWKSLIRHWQNLCNLSPAHRASAIMLTLSGKALNAALQVPTTSLEKEDGVDTLLKRLDSLYLKDELSEKFRVVEAFEKYRRPSTTSIREFLIEFENRHHKIKEFGMTISDDLLGYRLIQAANLSSDKEELVKATVTQLNFEEVKSKMKQIFSDDTNIPTNSTNGNNSFQQDTFHAISDQNYDSSENQSNGSSDEEAFYANKYQRSRKRVTFNNRTQQRQFSDRSSMSKNWRSAQGNSNESKNWRFQNDSGDKRSSSKNSRNPLDRFGKQTRCDLCESINHWADQCPDRPSQDRSNQDRSIQDRSNQDRYNQDRYNQDKGTYVVHELILHATAENQKCNPFCTENSNTQEIVLHTNSDQPLQMQALVAETWSSGLLDCGASKTVCGCHWLREYIDTLSDSDQSSVCFYNCETFYRFGDGVRVQAKQTAKIPAYIGDKRVFIVTDVVEKDLPLLLSKAFMKRAKVILDMDNDTLTLKPTGDIINLQTTHSGHYILPLSKPVQLISTLKESDAVILTLRNDLTDLEIALKLHRQFAHPTVSKLQQLVKQAGKPWNDNPNLLEAIQSVSSSCQTCEKYQKAPPRPVVGLPMATQFLETAALDIKFYSSRPILHIIDLCTRLSAAAVMPNKQPETVIRTIMQIWVSVYGTTEKFLVDNGGEFANEAFINMAEKFGITIKTTAGNSPWSNGVVERHNQTLGNMIDKVMLNSSCDLLTAVPWCVSAKNSLANVHGFSPFQLSIGSNPKLPSTLTDNIPSLTTRTSSKTLSDNLEALHKARQAFIECENSDRIRRALSHNIRNSGDIKYLTGDSVLYKRDNSSSWHGPGKVLGQEGQQVLIKHGSYYVRVHPCRIRLAHQPLTAEPQKSSTTIPTLPDSILDKPANQSTILLRSNTTNSNSCLSVPVETTSSILDSNDNANNTLSNIDTPLNETTNTNLDLSHITPADENSSPDTSPLSVISSNDHSVSETEPCEISNTSQTILPINIQPGINVQYINNKGQSITSKIDSRAGKANGKYCHWWNTTRSDGIKEPIDFAKVSSLELKSSADQTEDIFISHTKEAVHDAKIRELQQWKDQSVYSEVEETDQETISLRWVCTPKVINGIPSIKARLVAKGFEEQQYVRGDSPTCSREGVKISLAIIASHSWPLKSLDISTAFLQGGPINRELYVRPPKEAATDKIWKLRKSVYGLNDASRNWYLRLREELINLGATPIQLDQGIFCWYRNSTLVGLMVCFVDDILYGGDPSFAKVISRLKEQFKVGTENEEKFHYIGINIKQFKDSIVISQSDYVENLELISLTTINSSNVNRNLVDIEKTILRGALGQLNWLSGITRPEISFTVSEISSRISSATVADILTVNKTIKFVKSSPGYITIPKLDMSSLAIAAYSDSSFNNLPNGNSQGAFVVFLTDTHNKSCPVSWSSNKVKRVVRSTLAAETLAFTEAADTAFFIRKLLMEILATTESQIQTICLTDSQSLYETIGTSHQIADKRLRVEVSAIREMVEKQEIIAQWVNKNDQLSDVLTKKGASPNLLMSTLQRGSLLH